MRSSRKYLTDAIILIPFLFILVSTEAWPPSDDDPTIKAVEKVAMECSKFLNSSMETIKALYVTKPPENTEERCFLECIYDGIGMSSKGVLMKEGIFKIVDLMHQNRLPENAAQSKKDAFTCIEKYEKKPEIKCYTSFYIRDCMRRTTSEENYKVLFSMKYKDT